MIHHPPEPMEDPRITMVIRLLDNGIDAYIKESIENAVEPTIEGFLKHMQHHDRTKQS